MKARASKSCRRGARELRVGRAGRRRPRYEPRYAQAAQRFRIPPISACFPNLHYDTIYFVKNCKVRKRSILTCFFSASLSALLIVVALFYGRTICFCEEGFDSACLTEHCISCESCPSVDTSGDTALLTDSCACVHIHVKGIDLWSAVDDTGTCVSAGEVVWFAPDIDFRACSRTDVVLPPTTAPPDIGGDYVVYSVRALLRS